MKTIISKIKNCRKHKVVFRLETTGKKICTVKFTNKEFLTIKLAAISANITVEDFFIDIIRNAGKNDTP
jgi:hypothetical protein